MKLLVFFLLFTLTSFAALAQPVLKNPGLPDNDSYEILDYIDKSIGFVTAKINISMKERNGRPYYYIFVTEGNVFSNEIEVNYNDLTTISEKRVDLRTNTMVEYFTNSGSNIVHLYNKEKKLNKNYLTQDKNIYSRYAYFLSFSGFPFETSKSVTFKSYMFEYGDALQMKLLNLGKQKVSIKAGIFDCYKLELSLTGWQSAFAKDKYYFYYTVASPHRFVKYEEKENDGKWNADELIRILN